MNILQVSARTDRMDRCDRVHFLYTDRDGPRYPLFSSREAASPVDIPPRQRSVSIGIGSPTFSTASTVSTKSNRTDSSGITSASSASSVRNTPPWHAPPNLNQHLAMTPYNYGYDLPCEFFFQGCDLRFPPEQFEAWISHSTSHFVDIPPPDYTICTFCDDRCFQSHGDRYSNWRDRMIHIGSHFRNFDKETRLRPDFWVINYMRSKDLLSEDDFASAMKYTERPYCEGIVPFGYKTQETILRDERNSGVIYNRSKERRGRGKGRKAHRGSHHAWINEGQ